MSLTKACPWGDEAAIRAQSWREEDIAGRTKLDVELVPMMEGFERVRSGDFLHGVLNFEPLQRVLGLLGGVGRLRHTDVGELVFPRNPFAKAGHPNGGEFREASFAAFAASFAFVIGLVCSDCSVQVLGRGELSKYFRGPYLRGASLSILRAE